MSCGWLWLDHEENEHRCLLVADGHDCHQCACGVQDVRAMSTGPWRFDVPEVPDSVTAIKGETDVREHIFVRLSAGWWRQWSPQASCLVGEPLPTREILEYAPLVKCEDPRGTG